MPQMPCSQPRCVPLRPSRSRSASARVILGGAVTVTCLPLTFIVVAALWLAGHVLAGADEVRAADEVRDPPGEDRTPVGSRTGSALARKWA